VPRAASRVVVVGVFAALVLGVVHHLVADDPAAPLPGWVDSDPVATLPTRTQAPVPEGEGLTRRRAAEARAARGPVSTPTGTLGRTAEDVEVERQMATDNRARLFETNILSLHAAAAEAEADGRPEQAALMRKRARRLLARMGRES